MFSEPENDRIKLYAVNELQKDSRLSYKVTNLYNGALVCEGEAIAVADTSVEIAEVVVPNEASFYLIEWYIDGVRHTNHYMTKTRDLCAERVLDAMKQYKLDTFEGF
jgi:hypothetical protein